MSFRTFAQAALVGLALASGARAAPAVDDAFIKAYETLHHGRFVDLTHAFGPSSPHWKGYPGETVQTLYAISKAGFQTDLYCHVGQYGTHIDAPAHFFAGLNTIDQIDPKDLLLRLVVLDIHDKVAANPDYSVRLADVQAWESRHGRIPDGAFVALRTDWSHRWPGDAALQNRDAAGVAHTPGWSKEVLTLLYEDRHITATGHETTAADPGADPKSAGAPLESYILGHDHFQIELIANLDQVPEDGALLMVSFPKAEHGTGFPARLVAIAP